MSILEAIVAMGLLGLVMALLAGLASEYTGISKFSRSKDSTHMALLALERMTMEVEQARALIKPEVLGSADFLELVLVDSDSQDRSLDTQFWTPTRSSDEIQVRYELGSKKLQRRQWKGTSDSEKESLLSNQVSGFSVERPSRNLVVISLSMKEQDRVRTFHSRAYRWLP